MITLLVIVFKLDMPLQDNSFSQSLSLRLGTRRSCRCRFLNNLFNRGHLLL